MVQLCRQIYNVVCAQVVQTQGNLSLRNGHVICIEQNDIKVKKEKKERKTYPNLQYNMHSNQKCSEMNVYIYNQYSCCLTCAGSTIRRTKLSPSMMPVICQAESYVEPALYLCEPVLLRIDLAS